MVIASIDCVSSFAKKQYKSSLANYTIHTVCVGKFLTGINKFFNFFLGLGVIAFDLVLLGDRVLTFDITYSYYSYLLDIKYVKNVKK